MKPIAGALALLIVAPCHSQQLNSPAAAIRDKAASAETSAPHAPRVLNTLLDGTAVRLRLTENLSSASAKAGQQVPFEVIEEVDVEGVTVIAKGAQAIGTITSAEPKKTMGRGGKLDVKIDSVRLVDGEKIAISATKSEKGGGHTGVMTAGIVGTALVFFPAAPLLLFIHGKNITIPEGTAITAFVSGDDKLDMAQFVPGGAAMTTTVAGAAAPSSAGVQTASLAVESNVPGADIEVDGNFVGSTPSTLSVVPGQHTVTVKKTGYADWSRSMNVAGNSVHLNADLTARP